jgi:hypothetical protein
VLKRSTRLPPIRWNPRLVTVPAGRPLPTPDGWLPDVGIALEVDSREFHTSPESWARTLERHNVLSSYGALVLHFLPAAVRRRPAQVLDRVEQAYQERLRSGARAAIRIAES